MILLKVKRAFTALGGGRTGAWLMLRRCLNEVMHYRPQRCRSRRLRSDSGSLVVSAVVCTYNRQEKLLRAVNSLRRQTMDRRSYEIIVVNNGGALTPETLRGLRGVRIIEEARPGLSAARNAGARAAQGRYIVYIDDDAEAEPDMLELTCGAFDRHKRAGIVGGRILLRNTPPIVLPGHEDLWSQFDPGYSCYREVKMQYEFPFGANFAVRRTALEAAGGFDESYGRTGVDYSGGEETALCFSILKLGYKIGIEPRSVVWHNVDADRFTREHIRRTIAAGIMTTHRLYLEGYGRSDWNANYVRSRICIAEKEIERLHRAGAEELEIYYKECERDGFRELERKILEEEKGD